MSLTKEGAEKFNAQMEKQFGVESKPQEPSGDASPVEQEAQPVLEAEAPVEEPTQEVVETQAAEAPTEEAPAQEETTTEEIPSFSFGEEEYVHEEKPEDLKKQIELLETKVKQYEEGQSSPFASEEVAKINEYVNNGGVLNEDFFKAQALDVSIDYANEKSMLDGIRNKYRLVDGLSQEEADYLTKKQFPALFEDREISEESDIKGALLDLKMKARGVEAPLKEYKKRSEIPVQDPKELERQQQEYDRYMTETSHRLSKVNEFQFDLADDFPINVKMDKNSHEYISSLLLKPENLISYFKDNYVVDDKLDVERFAKDQFVLRNYQNLIKTATAQGESRGQRRMAQQELRQENLDSSKAKPSTQTDSNYNWQEQMLQTARNNNLV